MALQLLDCPSTQEMKWSILRKRIVLWWRKARVCLL